MHYPSVIPGDPAIVQPYPIPSNSMRFADAVESFYLYCRTEKQYALESQIKVKDCFNSWLLKHFGYYNLADIKPYHILQFRQALSERQLSTARQHSLLIVLKMFLKFCRSTLDSRFLRRMTWTIYKERLIAAIMHPAVHPLWVKPPGRARIGKSDLSGKFDEFK